MRRYSALKGMLRQAFGEELDFELSDVGRDAASWHRESAEYGEAPTASLSRPFWDGAAALKQAAAPAV